VDSAFGSGAAALAAGAGNVGFSAAGANESGQLGITWAGVEGSSSSDGGGHAGIALSVGGSGGQMSVSSGGAGADSAAGGHVDFIASPATALNGSVSELSAGDSAGSTTAAGSTAAIGSPVAIDSGAATGSAGVAAWVSGIGSSGAVGTVLAHCGVVLAASPLADDCVFDQSGSPFCMGRAGSASSSSVGGVAAALFSAGSTGTVCAHTGVVSLVGTAVAGSSEAISGGVEPVEAEGSVSKSQSV
jgi:hypothetical protein